LKASVTYGGSQHGLRLLEMRLATFARIASSIGVVDVLAILTRPGTKCLARRKLFIGHVDDVVSCSSFETSLCTLRVPQDLLGTVGSRSKTEE
jgi:hypothetical protein